MCFNLYPPSEFDQIWMYPALNYNQVFVGMSIWFWEVICGVEANGIKELDKARWFYKEVKDFLCGCVILFILKCPTYSVLFLEINYHRDF